MINLNKLMLCVLAGILAVCVTVAVMIMCKLAFN